MFIILLNTNFVDFIKYTSSNVSNVSISYFELIDLVSGEYGELYNFLKEILDDKLKFYD